REIIAIIARLKDPRLAGGLLTVTRLDVTPDLDVAKVYVSVLGNPDGPAPVVEALNRAAGHVRTELSRKMHIRKAPRLICVEDDAAADAAHLNQLLKELSVASSEPAAETDGEWPPPGKHDNAMTDPLHVEQAAARLRAAGSILILCHKNPDGDTVGCGS